MWSPKIKITDSIAAQALFLEMQQKKKPRLCAFKCAFTKDARRWRFQYHFHLRLLFPLVKTLNEGIRKTSVHQAKITLWHFSNCFTEFDNPRRLLPQRMEPYNKYRTRTLKLTRQFISINISPSLADFIFGCRRAWCCVRLGHFLTWTAFYKCWHLATRILSAHADMPARWRVIHFILPPKSWFTGCYFDLAVESNLSRHPPVWEMKSIQAHQINMVLLPSRPWLEKKSAILFWLRLP